MCCSEYFKQRENNSISIHNDNFKNQADNINLEKKYMFLYKLSEDKMNIYDFCNSNPHIYNYRYIVSEHATYKRDKKKKRQKQEVIWIYGSLTLGKTELAKKYLSTFDLTKKDYKHYNRLYGKENVIYDYLYQDVRY
jgi:hypothetical protein